MSPSKQIAQAKLFWSGRVEVTETTDAAFTDRDFLLVGLGDLGAGLAEALMERGARVTGLRRGTDAPAGVRVVRADASDPQALRDVQGAFDAAVICVTPPGIDEAGYRAGYLAVAKACAARFESLGISRVLWVSSTSVYGAGNGSEVDDDSPTEPEGFRGRILLEAEMALREHVPTTAVRLSGLYGPGRHAVLRSVLSGVGAPAEPVQWTNRIHRDDAISVLTFLLALHLTEETLPSVILATDPSPTPRHQVLEWLAKRVKVDVDRLSEGPVRSSNRRLIPRRLLALGYRFVHPDFRSGFEAIVAPLEVSGELDALRRAAQGD